LPNNETEQTSRGFTVRRLIGIGLFTRLLTDTGVQLFFPFLPMIAAGMGITPVALGRLVSLRSLMGLLAPLFGSLADRRGYRLVLRAGLLIAALGYAILGFSGGLPSALVGMVVAGVGTFAVGPTLQAYLSARLPYAQRARGLGVLEYAWALSGIVGLFLMGQLIAVAGWRAPLFVLSGTLLLAFAYYRRLPPASEDGRQAASAPPTRERTRPLAWLKGFFNLGPRRRSVWANLIAGGFIMFSGFHLFISFGSWLEARFGLGAAELGTVAFVLGLADLSASVSVSLIVDRLGKRRSVMLGAGAGAVGFLLLPAFDRGLYLAVLGLVLVRAAFEFTVVSNLPLLSEQAPAQRGKVMSLGAAVALLGPTLGGFTGPWAFEAFGVWGLSLIPAASLGLALLIVALWVSEGGTPLDETPPLG